MNVKILNIDYQILIIVAIVINYIRASIYSVSRINEITILIIIMTMTMRMTMATIIRI